MPTFSFDPIEKMTRFKAQLNGAGSSIEIVQSMILSGTPYVFDEDTFFKLKKIVATQFGIHYTEVFMVGSAKLGFSIAPHKRYVTFHDRSDIDLAIVSPRLFDEIWFGALAYKIENGYWQDEGEFKDYLFRGWIRPDKLPPSKRFPIRKQWWDFFQSLTSSGQFGSVKVSAALYRTHPHVETYQVVCVEDCRNEEQRK